MTQYIDKSALVSEIERLKECNRKICAGNFDFLKKTYPEHYYSTEIYNSLLSFLDTLEVKEVNNVGHNASETPKGAGDKEILVQFSDSHASVLEIDDWEYLDHQTKWAYLKDLI